MAANLPAPYANARSASKAREEWERIRGMFTEYYWYQNQTLPQTIAIIEHKTGFTATERQYLRQYTKWGLLKNASKPRHRTRETDLLQPLASQSSRNQIGPHQGYFTPYNHVSERDECGSYNEDNTNSLIQADQTAPSAFLGIQNAQNGAVTPFYAQPAIPANLPLHPHSPVVPSWPPNTSILQEHWRVISHVSQSSPTMNNNNITAPQDTLKGNNSTYSYTHPRASLRTSSNGYETINSCPARRKL